MPGTVAGASDLSSYLMIPATLRVRYFFFYLLYTDEETNDEKI